MIIEELVEEEYIALKKRVETTEFYKVDMHIHTPGSKADYKFNNKLYEKSTLEDIQNICIEKNLYTEDEIKKVSKNKDELMALLIVYEAFEIKKLDMFVVTDHNNIDWYENIRNAASNYVKYIRKDNRIPYILPGVELTCFSGAHIIAILDNEKYLEQWNYLKFDLKAENAKGELFTLKGEMDVIESIKKVGGIVYIPHLDNNESKYKISDMLSSISGISKAQLLTSDMVNAIGFRNYNKFKPIVEETLINKKHDYYRETPLAYLQDSDAHQLDEIGKSPVYIKMQKPSFKSLKFALEDPEVRVSIEEIKVNSTPHINGVVTFGGFLSKVKGKKIQSYYPFSRQFNCIIGGRGTGKSTLINCIKYCLQGRIENQNFKEFMAEFEKILIFFNDGENEYCLLCKPKVQNDNYIIKGVKKTKDKNVNAVTDISGWITLYKKNKINTKFRNQNKNKNNVIEKFYIDFFQQAEIFKIGENNEYILKLLEDVIRRSESARSYENKLDNIKKMSNEIIKLQGDKFDLKLYKEIVSKNKQLKQEYIDLDNSYTMIIGKLNESMSEKVHINYERKNINIIESLSEVLGNHANLVGLPFKELEEITLCINYLFSNYDDEYIVDLLLDSEKSVSKILKDNNIIEVGTADEYDEIDYTKYAKVILDVIKKFIKEITTYNKIIEVEIEFNVNSFDQKNKAVEFKNIEILSYGQKAVVILILITEGIAAFEINVPLIIDQPEDHLDNQYIYNDLVNNIRNLKIKRQIILVSHNASIPVCGDAENVICLKSDNKNGWLELNGPLDNEKVNEKIIKIMEGGEYSFNSRRKKYKLYK